jgi:hypothetical protein
MGKLVVKNDPAVIKSLEMDFGDDAINILYDAEINKAVWLYEYIEGDESNFTVEAYEGSADEQDMVDDMVDTHDSDTMCYAAHANITYVKARITYENPSPGDMNTCKVTVDIIETHGTLN